MSTIVRVRQRIDPAVEAARRQARAERRRAIRAAREAEHAAREAARQVSQGAREAARDLRRADSAPAAVSRDRRELQEIAVSWTSWEDALIVAEGLGYAVAQGGEIIDPGTEVRVPVDVTLVHPDGTQVGLARAEDGTTWFVSAEPHLESRIVRPLTRAVGAMRAVAALRAQGMAVECRELPDGEIQIEAARVEAGRVEGTRGRIDSSGSALLEVLGVKGPGCEVIVAEVARAMQAPVVQRAHTAEFYQRAGVGDSRQAARRE